MRFTKLNGCGNDFIVVNADVESIADPAALARKLCRRGHSVGADGLMLVDRGTKGDARMRLWNADGSTARMCGNGVRCAAKFAYDSGICRKDVLNVETGAGVLEIRLCMDGESVTGASVDMGEPSIDPKAMPMLCPSNETFIDVCGRKLHFYLVNTGVPHAVTFDYYPSGEEFARFGKAVERAPVFPEGTNACFARMVGRETIELKVWERGCGATLACGTGASAALFAAWRLGKSYKKADVRLPGGTLTIELEENGHLRMTGPAEAAFSGEV